MAAHWRKNRHRPTRKQMCDRAHENGSAGTVPKRSIAAGQKERPGSEERGPISQTLTQVLHLPCPSITQLIEVYTLKHKRTARACRTNCPCRVGLSTTTRRRKSEAAHDFTGP